MLVFSNVLSQSSYLTVYEVSHFGSEIRYFFALLYFLLYHVQSSNIMCIKWTLKEHFIFTEFLVFVKFGCINEICLQNTLYLRGFGVRTIFSFLLLSERFSSCPFTTVEGCTDIITKYLCINSGRSYRHSFQTRLTRGGYRLFSGRGTTYDISITNTDTLCQWEVLP